MANLSEASTWEAGIVQIERTDIADAGIGGNGKANQQAKQLANRTLFLKNAIDTINAKIKQHFAFSSVTVGSGSVKNHDDSAYTLAFPLAPVVYTTPNDGVTRNYKITICSFTDFTFNASGNIKITAYRTTSGPTFVPLCDFTLRYPFGSHSIYAIVSIPPNTKIGVIMQNNATGANATFNSTLTIEEF